MMNVNIAKIYLFLVMALLLAPISAETIAWYHFNEGENGERPAGGQPVILNAVNPEILKGTPYVDKTKGSDNLMVHTVDNNSEYMPVYTNVFPDGVSWYDPVTKQRGTDGKGLYFNTSGGDGSGTGGVVLVEDDPVLHCQNITVECMVKVIFHSAKENLKNRTHLITMRNSDLEGEGGKSTKNIMAWGLMLESSGLLRLHLHSLNEDGTKATEKSLDKASIAGVNIADGKWHHIAFTYNGAMARVYVDYTRVYNQEWKNPLFYNPNNKGRLSIGACDASYYGKWQGFIDEVRISNEALGTDKFLRPGGYINEALAEKIESVTDEDTAVYLPFDSLSVTEDDPFFGKTRSTFSGFAFNAVTNEGAAMLKTYFPTNYILPVASQETVSNQIYTGLYAANTVTNRGCWKFNENEEILGRSINMTFDNNTIKNGDLITSGDFTLEFFMNVQKYPTNNMYLVRDTRLDAEGKVQTALTLSLSSNGHLKLSLAPEGGGDSKYIQKNSLTKGQWHHIAVVVKRSAKTAALYCDGVCVGATPSDFILALPANIPESLEFCGGYGVKNTGGTAAKRVDQFQNLSVDELRITRRALVPQEFLMAGCHSTSELEPTRAWLGFEGDLKVEPRPNDIPEGAFDCESASQVPAYSDIVPGIRIADGTGAIIRDSNVSSMKFSGGNNRIVFGRNVLLEREMDSMTIEFFVKNSGEPVPWAYFARMLSNYNAKSTGGQRVWSVGYNGTMKNESVFGSIYVSIDNGPEQAQWQTKHINNEVTIADGRWHHIAVTYEPDGDNTASKVYVDYKQIGTAKYNGRMVLGDSLLYSSLAIGNDFSGWIDELRISKGVLTVNEMMRAVKRGTVVIFR
ncbi:MAG: LamG domain-containing protein [Kiritimatiellae bacterium]|nr:LamG domain-containing protein [Kiritimatiellia bacterium]